MSCFPCFFTWKWSSPCFFWKFSQNPSQKFRKINAHASEVINFPEDLARTKQRFLAKSRISNVIGAIECTHVKIQSPGRSNGEVYRNRKGFFSINVQAVADYTTKIIRTQLFEFLLCSNCVNFCPAQICSVIPKIYKRCCKMTRINAKQKNFFKDINS